MFMLVKPNLEVVLFGPVLFHKYEWCREVLCAKSHPDEAEQAQTMESDRKHPNGGRPRV